MTQAGKQVHEVKLGSWRPGEANLPHSSPGSAPAVESRILSSGCSRSGISMGAQARPGQASKLTTIPDQVLGAHRPRCQCCLDIVQGTDASIGRHISLAVDGADVVPSWRLGPFMRV